MTLSSRMTVSYTGDSDEAFEFQHDGQGILFGRDDVHCDIVIWSAINGRELSRVAGRIWRMHDELWLRNLSTRHELYLDVPDRPAAPPLPPRRNTRDDPGAAVSIPAPLAYVRGPAGCELLVRQSADRSVAPPQRLRGPDTVQVPPLPNELKAVAAALCEPLLRGGTMPAPYSEIARRTGLPNGKRMRTLVAKLCQPYLDEIPQARQRIAERRQREQADLELNADRTLRHGIWAFEMSDSAPAPEPTDPAHRPVLALPDYVEVAHLLVRRRIVTAADLAALPPPDGADHEVTTG
jgi:hypothetical protein